MLEESDFYIENGLYVFTKEYHLKRGYCCKSECRHCPWGYKKKRPDMPSNPDQKVNDPEENL